MQKKLLISLLLITLLILTNGCTDPNPPPMCRECIEEYHPIYGCISTEKFICPDGRCTGTEQQCADECVVDSDCPYPTIPDEEGNDKCLEVKCVNGHCDYPTVHGAECVFHYDCPSHPTRNWIGICGYNCKCTYAG